MKLKLLKNYIVVEQSGSPIFIGDTLVGYEYGDIKMERWISFHEVTGYCRTDFDRKMVSFIKNNHPLYNVLDNEKYLGKEYDIEDIIKLAEELGYPFTDMDTSAGGYLTLVKSNCMLFLHAINKLTGNIESYHRTEERPKK